MDAHLRNMRSLWKATVLWTLLVASGAVGRDGPFPSIEDVPERTLIGVDENGQPRIDGKDKPRVAKLAADNHTPQKLRFYAIWGLAISGYSAEAADGLAKAVEDRGLSDTDRGYAAMGLSNFTSQLPRELKEQFVRRLRAVAAAESKTTPDGILRTLITWGDAQWIAGILGDNLRGHEMEIEILSALKAEQATPRLLELYRGDEMGSERVSYNRRAEIGWALVAFKDKRGVDILEALLDAEAVPKIDETPNHQCRHNVFAKIVKTTGQDFGYRQRNYDPSIDDSIRRFRGWWIENRYDFRFAEASSAPKVDPSR
jgi:hypothetical protein